MITLMLKTETNLANERGTLYVWTKWFVDNQFHIVQLKE